MSSVDHVVRVMSARPFAHQVGPSVAVVTQCLFPSNGAVTVYVTGGQRECIVSDEGETARVVRAHGVHVPNETRWLTGFCRRYGLKEEHGKIYSPAIPLEHVESAIVLVANAASMAARYAIDEYRRETEESILEMIYAELVRMYGQPQVSRDVELAGESTRQYEFDFYVRPAQSVSIVADYVVPHAASINAKAAAHIDLSRVQNRPMQGLIYDSGSDWQSSDLSFLQSAAQLIPYQRLRDGFSIFTRH